MLPGAGSQEIMKFFSKNNDTTIDIPAKTQIFENLAAIADALAGKE